MISYGNFLLGNIMFPTEMRAIPKVDIISGNGTPQKVNRWANSDEDGTACRVHPSCLSNIGFNCVLTETPLVGGGNEQYTFFYEASADL